MAIDDRTARGSALAARLGWLRRSMPFPDGTIEAWDRRQLLWWYGRTEGEVEPPDGGAPPPTYLVYVPNVTVQEPPYSGPFDRDLFASPPFAVTDNPRNDEIRWCARCHRPVVVDDRPGMWHPHFDREELGEEAWR